MTKKQAVTPEMILRAMDKNAAELDQANRRLKVLNFKLNNRGRGGYATNLRELEEQATEQKRVIATLKRKRTALWNRFEALTAESD